MLETAVRENTLQDLRVEDDKLEVSSRVGSLRKVQRADHRR